MSARDDQVPARNGLADTLRKLQRFLDELN